MSLAEIKNRMIEILTNKSGTMISTQWLVSSVEELRKKILEILRDKHGLLNVPDDEIEAIVDTLLPDIIAYFESEEGKAEFEAWKSEQEKKKEASKNTN